MEEVNFDNTVKQNSEDKSQKPKTLKEKVDEMYSEMYSPKKKKIKIPRKARVKRGKVKKGWIGIIKIDENGNISGEKQKISGSVFNNKEGIYHATNGEEVLFWEGKYPVVIQPTWRNNPLNVKKIVTKVERDGKERYIVNETYGQPYIKAKMLQDVIKVKSKNAGSLLWIIGLIVAGYLAYSVFTGGV